VWYADDSYAAGRLTRLRQWLDVLDFVYLWVVSVWR
jgi:hypothetical protein